MKESWGYNDPEYPEPMVDKVRAIKDLQKINSALITGTLFTDTQVNLAQKTTDSEDYRYAVYAYIVRAVNNLGTESGPSPYALTIPSEPPYVFLREGNNAAEIKWTPNPEKGIAGYRVYQYNGSLNPMIRLTDSLVKATTYTVEGLKPNQQRFWVAAVDSLGQEGMPSSPVWYNHRYYDGFYDGEWHQ
jgi:hypothetical protein